jgi:hypothetical protein
MQLQGKGESEVKQKMEGNLEKTRKKASLSQNGAQANAQGNAPKEMDTVL